MTLAKLKLLFLPIIAVFILSACGGGSSTSSSTQTTKTTDFSEIKNVESVEKLSKSLNSLNINTTDELAKKVNKEDPLELFLQLKEEDASLKSEDMLNMMKDVEQEIVLKPLYENKKISQNAYESVKTLNKSIDQLKTSDLRVWQGIDETEKLDSTLEEKYIEELLISYNNELVTYGKEPLTIDEFKTLRDEISKQDAIFTNINNSMQNVYVDSSTVKKSRSFSKNLTTTKKILNQVDEEKGAIYKKPTTFLQRSANAFQTCKNKEMNLPFRLTGDFTNDKVEIDDIFLKNTSDNKREFYINKQGLAEVTLFNRTLDVLDVTIEHSNNNLISLSIPSRSETKVYIPVFEEDICVPYIINENDTNLYSKIESIQEAQSMQRVFDESTGYYNLSKEIYSNSNNSNYDNIQMFEFNIQEGSILGITREDIETDNTPAITILRSPSGVFTMQTAKSFSLDSQPGKWKIIFIPFISSNLYEFNSDKTQITKIIESKKYADTTRNNNYKLNVVTGETSHRKKFIVAEMKSAEFSKDGEDDFNDGEVTLSLHTNFAPKLSLGEDLEKKFTNNKKYQVLKCWQDHDKNALLFNPGQVCEELAKEVKELIRIYRITKGIADYDEENYQEAISINSMFNNITTRNAVLIWYEKLFKKQLQDEQFRLLYTVQANVREEWENNITQINDIRFPMSHHYEIQDSKRPSGIVGGVTTEAQYYLHPKIPMNIPILGLTKERMAKSKAPLSFEYSAIEDDEINKGAVLWSITKYVLNQALATFYSNYSAMVCNTINSMKELRAIKIAGEDDPIGEASFFLNRYSTNDNFYGLEKGDLHFPISGFAKIPNHYTSFDKTLDYASLACNVYGAVSSADSLVGSVGNIISGDINPLQLIALREQITSLYENGSDSYNKVNALFNKIEAGTASPQDLSAFQNELKKFNPLSGDDIFTGLESIPSSIGGLGAQGHNAMRSEANYYFSDFNARKTKSNISIKEVDGMPITSTKVNLYNIHIATNGEDDDESEIRLRTRVGVIGDGKPTYTQEMNRYAPYYLNGEFFYENGSKEYKTLPNLPFKGYIARALNFNNIPDNSPLFSNKTYTLYEANYDENNKNAAIYVEVGLFEDDGDSIDDDMIGVYSKTFYLEDLFNEVDGLRWESIGNNTFRLTVHDYPVYGSKNLASSVEILNQENRAKQLEHNRNRLNSPSALISFQIDVKVGSFTDNEKINIEGPSFNQDENIVTIDYDKLNLKEINNFYINMDKDKISNAKLHDIYNDIVVTHDGHNKIILSKIKNNTSLESYKTLSVYDLPDDITLFYDTYRVSGLRTIKLIDEETLLVFFKNDPFKTTLALIDLRADTFGQVKYKEENSNIHNFKVHRREGIILGYSIEPNVTTNSGQIGVYTITNSNFQRVSTHNVLASPSDIEPLNDNNILIKSNYYIKHKNPIDPMQYFTKKMYLTIGKLDDSYKLTEKGINQRTYVFQADTLYNNIKPDDIYNTIGMKTIKSTDSIKQVLLKEVYPDSYAKITGFRPIVDLVYKEDTDTYGFAESYYTEFYKDKVANNKYGYYITSDLKFYNSPNTFYYQEIKKDKDIYVNDPFTYLRHYRQLEFLDERYVLAFGPTRSGIELKIFDTLYIDNTAPTITGDEFNKEHILEFSNQFKKRINFKVTDKESSIEDLDITFSMYRTTNDELLFEGNTTYGTNTFYRNAKLICESNGDCYIDIDFNQTDTSEKIKFVINIDDSGVKSNVEFSVYLALSQPEISTDQPPVINIKSLGVYEDLEFDIVSQNESANGYIHKFKVENLPSWASYEERIFGGVKTLFFTGKPPIGSEGNYTFKVTASNDRYSVSQNYTITVAQPDTTPNNFTIEEINDGEISIPKAPVYSKTSFTLTGVNHYTPISIVGGEYSIDNEQTWRSDNTTITNNTKVFIRNLNAITYSTTTTSTLNIGEIQKEFISRTKADPALNDTTPDQFSFTDLVDVALSSQNSASITISGINQEASLTISNGEYSFNQKEWFTNEVTVVNGTTIYVRHTSSNNYFTDTNTTLTVGGVSDTFTSKTIQIGKPELVNVFNIYKTVNSSFSFTPTNNGEAVASWSIENKPSWLNFDDTTGTISASSSEVGTYSNIKITATNAGGESAITFNLIIEPKTTPYINNYYEYTVDDNTPSFALTDYSDEWGNAITAVKLSINSQAQQTLVENVDYQIINETLYISFLNKQGTASNVPRVPGSWEITIEANDYTNFTYYTDISSGAIVQNGELTLLNAPLRHGKSTQISYIAKDRFNNLAKNASITVDFIKTNNSNTFDEPYMIQSGIFPEFYSLENSQVLNTDENGVLSFKIKVPACVDIDDGFEIILKDSKGNILITDSNLKDTIKFTSTTTTCTDIDWSVNLAELLNYKILDDEEGNTFVVGDTTSRDIYFARYDRNGVKANEFTFENSDTEMFIDAIYENNLIYIVGTTNGAYPYETNKGLNDIILLEVNKDGSLYRGLQYGGAENDTPISLSKNATNVFMYTKEGSENWLYKFNVNNTTSNGQFISNNIVNIDFSTGAKPIVEDDEGHIYSPSGNTLNKVDSALSEVFSKEIYHHNTSDIYLGNSNHIYALGSINGYHQPKYYGEETNNISRSTILKVDSSGEYIWSSLLSEEKNDSIAGMAIMDQVVYVLHGEGGYNEAKRLYLNKYNEIDGSLISKDEFFSDKTSAYNKVDSITSNKDTQSIYLAMTYRTNFGQNKHSVLMKKVTYDLPAEDLSTGLRYTQYERHPDNFVIDYKNNIIWRDSADYISTTNYLNSSSYCDAPWEVPTIVQLQTTVDNSNNPAINSIFAYPLANDYSDIYFWSKDEGDTEDSIKGIIYNNKQSQVDDLGKESINYIRCVREIKQ